MKIERITPFLVDRCLLVRVYTDSGIVGNGEAGLWAHHRMVYEAINDLAEYFIGKDPSLIEHHFQVVSRNTHFHGAVLSAALSAIDVALWDILGKSLDRPVYQLLGGKVRQRINTFANVVGDTVEACVQSACDNLAAGYTSMRMMPFFSGFEQQSSSKVIDDAVAIVAAVREAVGPHVDLDRSRPTRYWRGDPRTSVVQLSVPACADRRQLSSRRLGRALAVLRAISASLPTVNDGSTRLARLGQFLPQRGDLSIGQAVTQQVGAGATPALVEVVQGLLHAMGRRVPEVCVLVPQPSLVRHPGPPFGQELVAQA